MRTVALETVRAIHDVTVVRVDEISQHDSDKYPDGSLTEVASFAAVYGAATRCVPDASKGGLGSCVIQRWWCKDKFYQRECKAVQRYGLPRHVLRSASTDASR